MGGGARPSQQWDRPSQQWDRPSQQWDRSSQQCAGPSQQCAGPSQQGAGPSQQGAGPSNRRVEISKIHFTHDKKELTPLLAYFNSPGIRCSWSQGRISSKMSKKRIFEKSLFFKSISMGCSKMDKNDTDRFPWVLGVRKSYFFDEKQDFI